MAATPLSEDTDVLEGSRPQCAAQVLTRELLHSELKKRNSAVV